jgi:hypothetical protein
MRNLVSLPAEALVASGLIEGHQVETIALFLLDHARGFDHAERVLNL